MLPWREPHHRSKVDHWAGYFTLRMPVGCRLRLETRRPRRVFKGRARRRRRVSIRSFDRFAWRPASARETTPFSTFAIEPSTFAPA
jgi:hypothetical protein